MSICVSSRFHKQGAYNVENEEKLNWEPPHTTKRDRREWWVRSSICTCCLKSSSMIWLSRLTSAFFISGQPCGNSTLKMKWQSWMLCGAAGTAFVWQESCAFVKGLTHEWLAKLFTGELKTCHKLELWRTDSVGKRNRSVRYRMRRNSSGLGM